MVTLSLCVFLLCLAIDSISGHGRLMDPPNRSSLWRINPNAPANYVDDQNNCGGKSTQWDQFGGQCGVCGDKYDDPHPQANENTGTYGRGIIAGQYTAGSIIDINVVLTTNHMGYFEFSLCVLDNPNGAESGESCFKPLTLGDGSATYVLPNKSEQGYTEVPLKVKLPDGVTCERCTFRWSWTVGNSWGTCDDGTQGIGCGPQETFRSCSDIVIS
ncbi:hypothetical protein Zmor_021267 [Zophobas morio]|uniref:Chitin-binding type-4 domain-containing protein n=1 Tax=Zophobas morio TaxID=2755281 RepID=A0AA38I859_9CUCU|nr:hypothetical protein Zmor_021267 [Zophobas morio]